MEVEGGAGVCGGVGSGEAVWIRVGRGIGIGGEGGAC